MFKYITFSIVLTALLAANLLQWRDPFLGVVLTLIYLLYFGRRLGALALPAFNHFWHWLFGPLFLLAGLSLLGTLAYYLYALTDPIIIFLIVIFPLGLIPCCRLFKKKIDEWPDGHLEAVPLIEPNTRPANRWAWLVLIGDGYLFYYLFSHATAEAIRSPWSLVSFKFFLIFFVLTFFLILFIHRTQSSVLSLFTIFVHGFLMLSAALIIYKLGYGFDPFIHRAAEEYIAKFGAILPKTPYYIGQYALVVLFSKTTALSVGAIDRVLLPLLEALILLPLVFLTLRHGLDLERQEARLGSLLFFLIPFGSMITTTPQDLANFFAIALILLAALYLTTKLIPWWAPLLITLTILGIHPMTGLPMAIFYLLMILLNMPIEKKIEFLKWPAISIITAAAVLLLPAAFVLFVKAPLHWPAISQIKDFFSVFDLPQKRPDQKFSFFFALIYHYQYFLSCLILIVSAVGGWFIFKKHPQKKLVVILSVLAFFIFIVNAGLLKFTITFPQIIDFEQGQYAGRLYYFSFYLLLPLFLYGMIYLIRKGRTYPAPAIWLHGLIALLLTVSFYLSYPREDTYAFSRYINTSALDIKAVQQIALKSQSQNYIVLSNTSFSAGALNEFGFFKETGQKYFSTPAGEIFYYALPTGGPLYNYYEKMVYENAGRETMNKAMDLVGVNQTFLVLHSYWNSFKTGAPQAKQTADEWWEVSPFGRSPAGGEGGKILVFRYKK